MGRYVIDLTVDGTPVVIEYDDDPVRIADRIPEVNSVLAAIQFP